MYEGQRYTGNIDIWNFPARLAGVFQYYNTFANLDPNAEDFAMRILHRIARKDDFVALKLDIDQPKEINLVLTMLKSHNAMALIDEFFFEHHTLTPIMASGRLWGEENVACQIEDTYNIFLEFRRSGVRAHGWP